MGKNWKRFTRRISYRITIHFDAILQLCELPRCLFSYDWKCLGFFLQEDTLSKLTLVFFFKLMSHHRQLTIFEFIAAALPVHAAAADVDLYHAPQKTVQQATCARASPRRAS